MVFASLVFLYLYLPLLLVLYFAMRREGLRNALLIGFSLVFYAWGEPLWITLLIWTSVFDYCVARVLDTLKERPTIRKLALAASLASNLGLLAVFKYSGLIVQSINDVTGAHLHVPSFALPLGISFYTFQAISYVVDVYRGEIPAQRNYFKLLFVISLFAHLVAGPIVRYAYIGPQIDERKHTFADFSAGLSRVCIGLFKKVVVANTAGELVARYLDGDLATLSVAEAWLGLCMFTFQIYFDFSGYSDMAIGLARMFGIRFHENFNYPYIARSVTDFWRRWHISLSSFFRDYVYIPLGGKAHRPYRNLFIVWALTGLWHGASWNFVAWGVYYGVLIALERIILRRFIELLPRVFQHAYLLGIVVVGWALFYFTDFTRLRTFLTILFGWSDAPLATPEIVDVLAGHSLWLALPILGSTALVPWLKRKAVEHLPPAVVGAGAVLFTVSALALATTLLVGKTFNPFLYFRF